MILAALVLLALSKGCGSSANYVGHWRGNRNLKPLPGQNPEAVYTVGRVEVWVRGNGTFEMSEGGIPMAGVVQYTGAKAILKVKTRFDHPTPGDAPAPEFNLEPQSDGTLLFLDPIGFDKPIKLERQPQPMP